MDKKLYIGEFRVRNCSPYGEYKIIDSLVRGDELKIEYNVSEKLIVVKAKTNIEVKEDDKGKLKTVEKWITIGELEISGYVRMVFVPLLIGKHSDEIFECKVSQINKNQHIDNQLRLSVWAKK